MEEVSPETSKEVTTSMSKGISKNKKQDDTSWETRMTLVEIAVITFLLAILTNWRVVDTLQQAGLDYSCEIGKS